jgi:hypothetical protein
MPHALAQTPTPTPTEPDKPPPGFTDDTCGQRYYCVQDPVRAKRLVDKSLGVCSSYIFDTEEEKPKVVCSETSCKLPDNQVPFHFIVDLKCKLPDSTQTMTSQQFSDFMTQYKKDNPLSYSLKNCEDQAKKLIKYLQDNLPGTGDGSGDLPAAEIDRLKPEAELEFVFRGKLWLATYKALPVSGFNFYACMKGKPVMNIYACPNVVPKPDREAEGTSDHDAHLAMCSQKAADALLDTFPKDGDNIDLSKFSSREQAYSEWQKFARKNFFGKPDLKTFQETFTSFKALRNSDFCQAPASEEVEAINQQKFADIETRFDGTHGASNKTEKKLMLPCPKCPNQGL